MNFKAIETSYAGHRFRSRLEARWAVFLDQLGISWEYEPEGYAVGPEGGRRPYLPDFWLPGEKLWVEVKGAEEKLDVELLLYAAIPHFGLQVMPEAPSISEHRIRLLILGPIDRVGPLTDATTGERAGYAQPLHTVLTFRKGEVFQGTAYFSTHGVMADPDFDSPVGDDSPEVFWKTRGSKWGNLVGGGVLVGADYDPAVYAAYRTARAARFEHGETPTPPAGPTTP